MGIFDKLFGPPEKVKRKVKRKVEGLIKALKDKNSNVRKKAVEALVEIGEPAVELLTQASKDEHFIVHEKAVAVLVEIFVKIGKPAVKPLIKALKDEQFLVQEKAAEALGKIGDAKAVKPLLETIIRIKYIDMFGFDIVRSEIVEALRKIGEPAVKPLLKAMKDEYLQMYAAQALGKIGVAKAVKPILQAFKSNQHDGARILVKIGKPAVIPLMQALKDKDEYVRELAARALVKLGWKPADDTEKAVYLIAKGGWNKLAKLGKPAVELLIQALKKGGDDPLRNRQKAAEALGRIGDAKAIEPLIKALKGGNFLVRWNVAEALGKIKDPRAVEPLIAALKDEDEDVRTAAKQALKKIKAKKS